jgi:hypothetical protein
VDVVLEDPVAPLGLGCFGGLLSQPIRAGLKCVAPPALWRERLEKTRPPEAGLPSAGKRKWRAPWKITRVR